MKKHTAVRAAASVITLATLAVLGGCVAVPYQQAAYPASYPAPYPAYGAPVYAAPAPAPVYTAPVYAGPPVYFGFNYVYRGGGGRGWRHGWGHRH